MPIEQMILDAKRLANRLKEKEVLADEIMNETVNCVRRKNLDYDFVSLTIHCLFIRTISWTQCDNSTMI